MIALQALAARISDHKHTRRSNWSGVCADEPPARVEAEQESPLIIHPRAHEVKRGLRGAERYAILWTGQGAELGGVVTGRLRALVFLR
jgi:hypothetical protein